MLFPRRFTFLARSFSTASVSPNSFYDIVVVGSGMVGATTACALGTNPALRSKRILLVDSKEPARILPTDLRADRYETRVVALSPRTVEFLRRAEIMPCLLSQYRTHECKRMQVWDCHTNSFITFQGDPLLERNVAVFVENDVLVSAVMSVLDTCPNVAYKFGSQLVSRKENPDSRHPCLEFSDGSLVKSHLVIGSDGFASKVRSLFHFPWVTWEYPQHALVGTLAHPDDVPHDTAWQRFRSHGPVALLPIGPHRSSLVYFAPKTQIKELLEQIDERFIEILNASFTGESDVSGLTVAAETLVDSVLGLSGCRSDNSQQLIPPRVIGVDRASLGYFPCGFGHAPEYVREGVALVGDAAHRIHPLAGQGGNLGFSDAEILTDVLYEIVSRGGDVGVIQDLAAYETRAQRHNLPVQMACDLFSRTFCTPLQPLPALRSAVTKLAHHLTSIKELLSKQAGAVA